MSIVRKTGISVTTVCNFVCCPSSYSKFYQILCSDLRCFPEFPYAHSHTCTYSCIKFFPKGSKDTYPMRFRIIRIKISEGLYETLVTNLWEDTFSAEDIRKIYKMRWGIETSFRELKYHIGLIAFHSKKKDCMIQEIFASLIMYNFSMLITENIALDDDKYNHIVIKSIMLLLYMPASCSFALLI